MIRTAGVRWLRTMKRGNKAVRSQPAEMELAEMLVLYFSISMCIRVHGEGEGGGGGGTHPSYRK
jgi:hypothetical protein